MQTVKPILVTPQQKYKKKNRDVINSRRRELYAQNPEKHRARSTRYRKENPEKVNTTNRRNSAKYRVKMKKEAMEAYGSECNCCGEDNRFFLQLDHINNDGHLDRKKHLTSTKLFAHLKKKGWPKDNYQLLCANCNFGKMLNGGVCPHKTEETQ